MTDTEDKIRRYMDENWHFCFDHDGEFNKQLLIDSCAKHFNVPEWLDDLDHMIWDIAEEYQR